MNTGGTGRGQGYMAGVLGAHSHMCQKRQCSNNGTNCVLQAHTHICVRNANVPIMEQIVRFRHTLIQMLETPMFQKWKKSCVSGAHSYRCQKRQCSNNGTNCAFQTHTYICVRNANVPKMEQIRCFRRTLIQMLETPIMEQFGVSNIDMSVRLKRTICSIIGTLAFLIYM